MTNQTQNEYLKITDDSVVFPVGLARIPPEFETLLESALAASPLEAIFLPHLLRQCVPGSHMIVRDMATRLGLLEGWQKLADAFPQLTGKAAWSDSDLQPVFEKGVHSMWIDSLIFNRDGRKFVRYTDSIYSLPQFEVEFGMNVEEHLQHHLDSEIMRFASIREDLLAPYVTWEAVVQFDDGLVGSIQLRGPATVRAEDLRLPAGVNAVLHAEVLDK